jgi:hypothetical protein
MSSLRGFALIWSIAMGGTAACAQSLDYFRPPPPSKCTTINCESLLLRSTVNGKNSLLGSPSNPWVGAFHSRFNTKHKRCFRLEVTEQNGDLAMSVADEWGKIYTNDNSGGCAGCPRIVIRDENYGVGPLVVLLNTPDGAPKNIPFTLVYGVYLSFSNPNCSHPTSPK